MAKVSQAVLLLVTAICISSLDSFVHCHDKASASDDESYDDITNYMGRVFCDTCDAGFITPVTEGLEGVNVTITCRDREGGNVTYTVGAATDGRGVYSIPVTGNHEKEVCDIEVQQSPRLDCEELVLRGHSSRIRISLGNGINAARYVKPFAFRKKEPLEECPEVLAKMGLTYFH